MCFGQNIIMYSKKGDDVWYKKNADRDNGTEVSTEDVRMEIKPGTFLKFVYQL